MNTESLKEAIKRELPGEVQNCKWDEQKAEQDRKWEEQNRKWVESGERFDRMHEEIMGSRGSTRPECISSSGKHGSMSSGTSARPIA